MKRSSNYPRKRYSVRELDAAEGATDALKWVERELMNIDRMISDALKDQKV